MIKKLPELALIEVFKHLEIYDQLAIRRVCKPWKAVVESQLLTRRRELILFYKTGPRALFWFHDGSPVDLTNSVISNDQFKLSKFFWKFFKNIRRLYIVCYLKFIYEPDPFEFVNRFTHLEHLQVDVLPYDEIGLRNILVEEFCLNLPNLKSFCCHNERYRLAFRLNCPRLEQFSAPCDIRFDEKRCASFRESLKFLKVRDYYFKPGFSFPNLESFLFQTISCSPRNRLKIADHPKLKEIHIYSDFFRGKHKFENIELNNTLASELLKQKARLGRREPDIFCLGLRWSPESAEEILRRPRSYLTRAEAELFRENSEDLKIENAKRNLIYAPDIDNYLATLDEQQVERLARCMEAVEFPEILRNDPALTAKYQTLFNYVQVLRLSEQFKDQRDLDRLPELFPNLLEIKEGSLVSFFRRGIISEGCSNPTAFPNLFRKSPFNFDFLARFPALIFLETDRWTLSRGEIERILQNCRFLRKVILSRRKLVESSAVPIRTELSIFTISLPHSTAIKMKVLRKSFKLVPLSADREHAAPVRFRGPPVEPFSSFGAVIGYLYFNGYFFDEN